MVTTLTIEGGQLVGYTAHQGRELEQRVVLAEHEGLDWSPRCWPAVIAALDRLRPHWLHIQYQTGAYAMRPGINLLPWRLRGLAARPLVAVTFHDLLEPYLFPRAGPVRRWVNARLARDADAAVATNPADARALAALIRPPGRNGRPRATSSRLFTIPIGTNIPVAPPAGYERAAWRASLGVAADELLVAYFGLLAANKGVDTLVEALAGLATPWRLLLIGGAATAPQDVAHAREVQARIAALGLATRVTATGHIPPELVSAHLLAADLAALPFRDGASFRRGSLLAALAHGCPVVTTTPVNPDDAATLTPAAVYVPPASPAALRAALARLAGDRAALATLAAGGPPLAANYRWEAIAARHATLYTSFDGCPPS